MEYIKMIERMKMNTEDVFEIEKLMDRIVNSEEYKKTMVWNELFNTKIFKLLRKEIQKNDLLNI